MEQLLLLSPLPLEGAVERSEAGLAARLLKYGFPRVVMPRKQRLYAASFYFRASFIGLQGGFLDFARNDDTHGTAFTIVLSLPFRYNKEN
ncbi:MAG TPA: hypothetical protein DCG08_03585 [Dialister sp.]|nr:hypothetical protein [Dialister sp.]